MHSKFIVSILVGLVIFGCGKKEEATTSQTFSGAVLKHGSDSLGFVMDFIQYDFVHAYIPSIDQYVRINLTTGKYRDNETYQLWFTTSDCSGTVYSNQYHGVPGKTVTLSANNGKYYLVKNVTSSAVTIASYQSSGITCKATSFSVGPSDRVAILEEVTRPYDFESIAPLTIEFK
ncbi:MAG: hypothetical protein HYR96_06080 [Deltaproteobacteria bacterium]|nr:hypothetical protein [Deltaproteobacteria bacterium]MBI3293094.1 hypothetical protein [Deltaproteobacteria bacterium]